MQSLFQYIVGGTTVPAFLISPGDAAGPNLSTIWRLLILCFSGYNFSFYLVLAIF